MATPSTPAMRLALARKIGVEMSAASKQKKAQYASANFSDSQGFPGLGNRGRKQADKAFDDKKKDMVARLKASGT